MYSKMFQGVYLNKGRTYAEDVRE